MPDAFLTESWSQAAQRRSGRTALTLAGHKGTQTQRSTPSASGVGLVAASSASRTSLLLQHVLCKEASSLSAALVRGERCWCSREIPAQHTACSELQSFNSPHQALAPSTRWSLTPSQTASWGARKALLRLLCLKRASDRHNPDVENHFCLFCLQTPEPYT